MKSLRFGLSFCLLGFVLSGLLALVACGGGSSSTNPPPKLGSMAGSWDFTVIGGKNPHPIAIEATLTQDSSGNISGAGTVTANGPAGNVLEMDIFGASLSAASDMAVDYLGNTCNGTDTGTRSMTGTINSSNQVALSFDSGGAFTATISGTLSTSASPPFTGTVSTSGACGGAANLSITGIPASSLAGNYSGTSAADNTETVTATVTDSSGTLGGNGTDSVLGDFTLTGTSVGNGFSGTITFASSPANSGPIFGYFDPQLGAKGSVLLVNFQGGSAASCPSGVPIDNGSCLITILALQ